jgi:hypothetical protein
VLKQLLTKARKLQFIADWLDLHQAKRASGELDARHKKGLEEAKARNAPPHELDRIQAQYRDESEIIWNPIRVRVSQKLIARARKYWLQVPDQPINFEDNESWWLSHVTGDWMLSYEAQERLTRGIRDEERQRNDELRKWTTVLVSIAAFILALVSLTTKQKQPDPCPKNYYRSDSGECVFVLQKEATSQPQQVPAPPSIQPTKPSPVKPKP